MVILRLGERAKVLFAKTIARGMLGVVPIAVFTGERHETYPRKNIFVTDLSGCSTKVMKTRSGLLLNATWWIYHQKLGD